MYICRIDSAVPYDSLLLLLLSLAVVVVLHVLHAMVFSACLHVFAVHIACVVTL